LRANGAGSPNERNRQAGLRAIAQSTTCGTFCAAQVMKPMPIGTLPAARYCSSRSGSLPTVPA
jgi:hypothetical protein